MDLQLLSLTIAAITPLLLSRIATGQADPSQAVRIVVGFPVGDPVDVSARIIAPWLSERLGQPFVVDNQPGESGNKATRWVVRAVPDEYALLVCGPANAINTTLFEGLDFQFGRDIIPVAGLWRVPLVIEVHPSVAARTLGDLIAYAKANPGKLKVGFAGNGTPEHVGIEMFKMMAGIDLTLVPYPGSTPALADLLAGRIDVMFDPVPSSIAHIKSGKLIALAVTAPASSAALPDIPAATQFMPGYEAGPWFGLGAPRSLPCAIVEKLNAAVNTALENASLKARIADLGATAIPGTPIQFETFIAHETEKYADAIKKAKLRIK